MPPEKLRTSNQVHYDKQEYNCKPCGTVFWVENGEGDMYCPRCHTLTPMGMEAQIEAGMVGKKPK